MKLKLLTLALLVCISVRAEDKTLDHLPLDLVTTAVRTKAPRWKFVENTRMREMPETFALQITAVAAHEAPDLRIDDVPLSTHLARKLRFFLVTPEPYPDGSTREPESQGGIGGWTHNVPAHALLLAKRTPEVWDQLSADEHHRADVLMQALALAAHWSLDDDNDFYILLDGWSLYHKSWNPNHVEGYVGVIISAALYFGADELNAFFRSFDFDTFVAELDRLNFQNIRACWTWTPAIGDLMMHGGSIAVPDDQVLDQGFVSSGAGVRNDFTHRGMGLDEPWALHRSHAMHLFHKIVRSTINVHGDLHGHLMQRQTDAIRSPYEGQTGMIYELEAGDWSGMRTSAHYAFEAAMIDINNAVTLKALGVWDAKAGGDTLDRRMAVGMGDFLFRIHEGYAGWANGKPHETWWEKDITPIGGDFIIGLWRAYFPPPPPPSLVPAARP